MKHNNTREERLRYVVVLVVQGSNSVEMIPIASRNHRNQQSRLPSSTTNVLNFSNSSQPYCKKREFIIRLSLLSQFKNNHRQFISKYSLLEQQQNRRPSSSLSQSSKVKMVLRLNKTSLIFADLFSQPANLHATRNLSAHCNTS